MQKGVGRLAGLIELVAEEMDELLNNTYAPSMYTKGQLIAKLLHYRALLDGAQCEAADLCLVYDVSPED